MTKLQQLILLFGLTFPIAAIAGMPSGGDEWETNPPIEDTGYELHSAWTERSNSLIHFSSNEARVTIDVSTNRAYFANGAQVKEFYIPSTLSAGGFSPSLDFSDAFPGAATDLFMAGEDFGNGPIPPCFLSPCVQEWDPITGSSVYVDVVDPGELNLSDFLIQQDRNDFNEWREGECEAFQDSLASSLTTAPAVGISCASGEGWFPETICAAGWINEIYQTARRAGQQANCASQYPGPGRWEGSDLPQGYGQ